MKRWFDDWSVSYKPYLGRTIEVFDRRTMEYKVKRMKLGIKKGSFIINLPNSAGGKKHYVFYASTKKESEKLSTLLMLIDCALYELTKKKWYQFWRRK